MTTRTRLAAAGRLLAAGYLVAVAALTLAPAPVGTAEPVTFCLLCGSRGLADAILNVLLFVPVGLIVSGRRWPVALGLAVGLSGGIELLQVAIPGRHSTPIDVVYNALGAAGGVALGRISELWVHPDRYWGDRMATVAAILGVATLPLTAWLMEQDLPEPPYRVEWETSRESTVPYPGEVLAGLVQPLPLPPGPSGRGEVARDLLERGALFGVVAETGPQPEGLAQVLALYDREDRLVAFLGVDGSDLVYLESTRAARLRLDNPDVRARGVLDTVAAGDTVQLATGAASGRRCFLVGTGLSCTYGISGGGGWRLLYAMNGASSEVITVGSIGWLALLLFPVGYWARWHLALGLGAAFAAYAWINAPRELGLLAIPPLELSGVALGVGLGLLTRWLVRRSR